MSAVVTDTHALIWYLFEPQRLSPAARTALLQAEADPGIIYVPVISVVEARYLVEKGSITEEVFGKLFDCLVDANHRTNNRALNSRNRGSSPRRSEENSARYAGPYHCGHGTSPGIAINHSRSQDSSFANPKHLVNILEKANEPTTLQFPFR